MRDMTFCPAGGGLWHAVCPSRKGSWCRAEAEGEWPSEMGPLIMHWCLATAVFGGVPYFPLV